MNGFTAKYGRLGEVNPVVTPFWEHLGMLEKPKYKKDRELKQAWDAKHFPDCLLVTTESPNLSKTAQKLIEDTFV